MSNSNNIYNSNFSIWKHKHQNSKCLCPHKIHKIWNTSRICMSSLRRAGVMLITIIRLIPTQIACKLGLAQRSVEARGVGRLINLSGLGIAPCPQPDISLNDRVPRYSRAHALHHLRIGKSLWPMAIGHHWLGYLK